VTSPQGSTIHPGGLAGQVWMDGVGWVQPIRDQRGNILYYADPTTGARVNRNINGPERGPGSGNTTTAAQAQKVIDQRNSPQVQQQTSAAARATVGQQVWLNGKLVTITPSTDAQGTTTWTANPVGGGEGAPVSPPTAFDALDGNALDGAAPFVLSWSMPKGADKSMGGMFAAQKNMLTVGAGAAWLAELSTKDPEAYQVQLDKLHSAGYLSDADYAAAAGKWSSAAGTAFATAARDVAVINTTVAGAGTTLDKFLDSKQGAADAAKAKSKTPFQPVRREFTDPEAIKASAKSEAQQFLGRGLTDAEEAQLVSHFHGLESAMFDQLDVASRTNYDRADAGQDGVSVSVTPPNPTGQVNHFVEDTPALAQEGAGYRASQYGEALKQLFSQTTRLA